MYSDLKELSNDPPGTLKNSAASHVCLFIYLKSCELGLTKSIHHRTCIIITLSMVYMKNAILENVVTFDSADDYFLLKLKEVLYVI